MIRNVDWPSAQAVLFVFLVFTDRAAFGMVTENTPYTGIQQRLPI